MEMDHDVKKSKKDDKLGCTVSKQLADSKDRTQMATSSALIVATVVALKQVIEAGPENNKYYMLSLCLVSISLTLQVLSGFLLIMVDQMQVNTRQLTESFWNKLTCCIRKPESTIFTAFWCQMYQDAELGPALHRFKEIKTKLFELRFKNETKPSNVPNNRLEPLFPNKTKVHNIEGVDVKDKEINEQDDQHSPSIGEIEKNTALKEELEEEIITRERELVEKRLSQYYFTLSLFMFIVITINVFVTAFGVVATLTSETKTENCTCL